MKKYIAKNASVKISILGEEIIGAGRFDIPFADKGSISFSGSFNPIKKLLKIVLPCSSQRCDIISKGLFFRWTLTFLTQFTDFENDAIVGKVLSKVESRTEPTKLFNILIIAVYLLFCFAFIYQG